jgi:hypothetical protein
MAPLKLNLPTTPHFYTNCINLLQEANKSQFTYIPMIHQCNGIPPLRRAHLTHHYVSCTPTGYPAKQTNVYSKFWKHLMFFWKDIPLYEVLHHVLEMARSLGLLRKYAYSPSVSPVCCTVVAFLQPGRNQKTKTLQNVFKWLPNCKQYPTTYFY